MKPSQIESYLKFVTVALLAMTMTITRATPIPSKDSITSINESGESNREENMTINEKVIGTCLLIAPNLPPCNFDSEATWRSRNGEILHGEDRPAAESSGGYSLGTLPNFFVDGSGEKIFNAESPLEKKDRTPISKEEKNLRGFDFYENGLAITVVYYLEGCLPARLPFDLPSCPIDELQTIQMNKLIPFQLPDVQDALIFPEIDVKQIEFSHRQSRAPQLLPSASQSHEESKGKKNRVSLLKKNSKLFDRSSSFLTKNGNRMENVEVGDVVETTTNGFQDFHKMMLKSNRNIRTGTASEKYVNTPQGSGLISMISGRSWSSEKNNKSESRLFRLVKNDIAKPSLEDRQISVYGTREVSHNMLLKDKNRVQ